MKRLFLLLLALIPVTGILAQDSPLYMTKADSASVYIEREAWADAERVLLEALRLEPANFNNSLLLNNLARVMTQTGRYDKALENYDLALGLAPANSTIRYNRGLLLFTLGRTSEAIEDFSTVSEADGAGTAPILMRALCYMKDGAQDKAEADFRSVIAAEPENADAIEGLSGLLLTSGRYEEAASLLRDAVSSAPSAYLYFRLGLAQALSGRLSDADESVREGVRIDPEMGNLYLLRAYIHQQRYQTPEKEADIRTGIGKGGDMTLFRGLISSKK